MVPPGGWKFKCWNNVTVHADSYEDLQNRTQEYYLSMHRGTAGLKEEVLNYCCERSPNQCHQVQGQVNEGIPHHEIFREDLLQKLIENANRLADNNNAEMASPEEAQRRANICKDAR